MITQKNCTALLQIYSTLLWISKNQFLIYVSPHGGDKVAYLKKETTHHLSWAIVVVRNEPLSMKDLLGEAFGQETWFETSIPRAHRKGDPRDRAIAATKTLIRRHTAWLELPAWREVGGMMRTTTGRLERRDTDYINFMFIPFVVECKTRVQCPHHHYWHADILKSVFVFIFDTV